MNLLSNIKENKKSMEFIRFIIVGGVSTLIHYLIYFILQILKFQYNIAYTFGYFISLIFNFFASNYFTFKTNPSKDKSFKFLLSHLFNYILQILLLNIYILIGINKNIAPIFVFFISVPINYILVRFSLKNMNIKNKVNNNVDIFKN